VITKSDQKSQISARNGAPPGECKGLDKVVIF